MFEGSAAGKVYAVSKATQRTTTHSLGSEVATHFVGREDELLLIASRWRRARDRSSQLVLVRGEPGIGKTRLVEEFHAGLAEEDHAWLVLQGSSMFPNTPYHALEQMVQAAQERRTVEPDLCAVIDAAALLFADPEGAAQSAAAEQQRSRQQAALLHAVFELSEARPLVMLIDDLQWIDPSTLEFIEMLVEQADQDRILFLATARPEFVPPWPEQEHHSRLTLGRLGQEEIRRLVEDSLGAQLLPAESVASLVERADGVPLFAEELARMFAGGQGDGQGAVLPSTLRALLVARMDRLGGARELLQIGSVLGRSFTYELLQEVAGSAENELVPLLGVLTDEQLLIGRGRPPHVTYRFKHALLQDAAYETLPKKRQRELHRQAAEAIVARFPDMAEGQRELLASHWSRAGAHAEAIAAWIAAGDAAFARAASKEAIAHFKAGIELAGKLAEGADRDAFELDLWSKLNRALQLARGYADPETVAAARKSVELATRHGALAKIIMEEAQFWRSAITAGDYLQADEIAEKLVGMADRLGPDNPMPWVAYFKANSWIQTGFYSGRIAQFEEHWAELEQMFSDNRFNHSANDDVVAIGVGSLAAWMGGRSDLARQRIQQAIDLAEGSNQPYAVAVAHHFAGTLTAFERDRAATLDHSRKAVEVCEANGYEYIRHLARAKLGWAGAADSISTDDIESMRQALERMIESNALVGMILNMNRLAIALEGIGQISEALEVAERALVINPQERVARPQTFEIRGRLFEAL
ncbi:MAG: AAA family ATPase, partial [Novosphingobium sp.]